MLSTQQTMHALPSIKGIINYVKNRPTLQKTLACGAVVSIFGLMLYANKKPNQNKLESLNNKLSWLLENPEFNSNSSRLSLLLLSAIQYNDKKTVEKFVQQVSNAINFINQLDENGDTPLIIALRSRYEDIAKILIDAGANVTVKNEEDSTALIYAARNGCVNILTDLIRSGAQVNEPCNDLTPLMVAILADQENCIKELIAQGADVNINTKELSPLIAAILGKNMNILQMLIDAGANINQKGSGNYTPIAGLDYIPAIKKLLAAGAIIDDIVVINVIEQGQADVLKEFIPFIDINKKMEDDCTFLAFAVHYGHINIIKALINAGADLNAKDQNGYTALMQAARSGNLSAITELIKAGADIEADCEGLTALFRAITPGKIDAMEMLISAGANINAKTTIGITVLMHAIIYGHLDIIQKLINEGADVNAKDKQGNTVLTYAKFIHNTKIQKMLEDAGAKE